MRNKVALLPIAYFNPRTHEECDFNVPDCFFSCSYFNPRTHEECDIAISTMYLKLQDFNPRTHEECDVGGRLAKLSPVKFQSTHSRGVRPCDIARR